MAFSAIVRALGRSQLTQELLTKLDQNQVLDLNGLPRLPKGLLASAISQERNQPLLVVTATLEEAGRWATQLEAMGWSTLHWDNGRATDRDVTVSRHCWEAGTVLKTGWMMLGAISFILGSGLGAMLAWGLTGWCLRGCRVWHRGTCCPASRL
jgi:hypothetical protein